MKPYLLKNIVEIYWYHTELLICFPKRSKGGKGERGENVSGTSTESSYLIQCFKKKIVRNGAIHLIDYKNTISFIPSCP